MTGGIDMTCPKGSEHEWASVKVDGDRRCVKCGRQGRAEEVQGVANPGFFAEATAARAELFSRLRQPESVKGWGKAS